MNAEGISTAVAAGRILAAYWPLFLGAIFVIIAVSGVCALFHAAESGYGKDDNVVNFEKWRD